MREIDKYSFGIGDRFSHTGRAQLEAPVNATTELGLNIAPVWNKSFSEHNIVHSLPADTRAEADDAVKVINYTGPYFVNAGHINLTTVDRYIEHCDFFALDVADYIGTAATDTVINSFMDSHRSYCGDLKIPGISEAVTITEKYLRDFARRFLLALKEAAELYRYIASGKGEWNFITEVSLDEVDEPQKPLDLLFILKVLADMKVPVQTVAPKFTGRFSKGVDYEGDPVLFAQEFEEDILVIKYAVRHFGLPESLSLSVHTGSDRFSIYRVMSDLIPKRDCGLHLETAGTTWLEEIIGLSLAGGNGLDMAKKIYHTAYFRRQELCGPYTTVIDIRRAMLPHHDTVNKCDSLKFSGTMRHVPGNPGYNPGFRQLKHVGYKVAAELGKTYTDRLRENERIISACVWENICRHHIIRLLSTDNNSIS